MLDEIFYDFQIFFDKMETILNQGFSKDVSQLIYSINKQ
jgi:hypothetical protein